MKSKIKLIIFVTIGIFLFSFTLSSMISTNFIEIFRVSETEGLKLSKTSNPIFIDDNNPSHNWSVAKSGGICTGEGTYSDPYIIEDLVIDCLGTYNLGILIVNSTVFFKIENCTIYDTSFDFPCAGIQLINVNNSQLIDNNCYACWPGSGIGLENSYNNSISGNILTDAMEGVSLAHCKGNTITGNSISIFTGSGILLENTNDTLVSGNSISDCNDAGIRIDICYSNNITGNTANNNGDYGIRIFESKHNKISGNIVNRNDNYGIFLDTSNDNTLSVNTVNNNDDLGIHILNSDNNTVSGNTVSYNNNEGIYLETSNDNTISGNTLNYNDLGIYSESSNDNTLLGNSLSNNDLGIVLNNSERIDMSGNTIDQYALQISGTLSILASHDIDATNLVNGKPIYYYANEVNLGPGDFTNGGQVILVNCDDSLISNLDISYCPIGIALYYCNNNTISGNTLEYNDLGIWLDQSNYNTVSGNTFTGNGICIDENNCEENEFSDNGDCDYGIVSDEKEVIPGFNLFFLLGILSIVSVLISTIIKRKQKIKQKN